MFRYIKLYFSYIKRAIIGRLEYKVDTLITIISFLVVNVCSILSIYYVMQSIPSLDGWDMYKLGFLYGFTMMPVAVDHLFTDELWRVAYFRVKQGDMDRLFTRPIPVLFQVIAEMFQLEGLGELIVGIVMLAICGGNVGVAWSFGGVFMLVVATIFGAVIITSFKIIFSAMAFKFGRSGTLLQVAYNFISYTRYPISIYPKAIRALLTFIFPFAIVISVPVNVLFGIDGYSPYAVSAVIVAVAAALLAVSVLIWSAFAKRYQSTGN